MCIYKQYFMWLLIILLLVLLGTTVYVYGATVCDGIKNKDELVNCLVQQRASVKEVLTFMSNNKNEESWKIYRECRQICSNEKGIIDYDKLASCLVTTKEFKVIVK